MPRLDEYIYGRVRQALERIQPEKRPDIYVLSLFICDEGDDPLRPTIQVGFNTESNLRAASGDPEEAAEERWNYASYPQNELDLLFASEQDLEGAQFLRDAIEQAGYVFEESLAREITTPWFVANTVFAARRLHDAGDILRTFGRPIPVLVHELEYYDVIAMQNMAANPPGVADEFIRWCRNLGPADEL